MNDVQKGGLKSMKRFIIIVAGIWLNVIMLSLAGCATYTYHPTDKVGNQFKTSYALSKRDIKVAEQINLKLYDRLLVIGIRNKSNDVTDQHTVSEFWLQSIKSMHQFHHVVLIENLVKFLKAQGYDLKGNTVVYNLDGLKEMTNVYGNFLFAEIVMNEDGSLSLSIINPVNSNVYFHAEYSLDFFTSLMFSDNNDDMFYPMLNALNAWLTNNRNKQ